jgi:hypothetical protein
MLAACCKATAPWFSESYAENLENVLWELWGEAKSRLDVAQPPT